MPRFGSPMEEGSSSPSPPLRPLHPRISPPAWRQPSAVVRPSSPSVDSGPRVLGVFGMSGLTRESDLRRLFSRYGEVVRVMIVHDPKSRESRGFGFVYFERARDANHARKMLNGTELHGRELRVAFSTTARPHSPTPGFYKGNLVERIIQRNRSGRRRRRREVRRRRNRSRRTPSPFDSRRRRRSRSRSIDRERLRSRRTRSPPLRRSSPRRGHQPDAEWYGHPGFRRVRSPSPYYR